MENNVRKYVFNTSWLFAEKILRAGVILSSTVLLARHLGPEQFGTLNYAISFVAIFAVLAYLGLDKVLTKELVNNPDDTELLMGSSFILRIIASVIIFPIVVLSISVLRPNDALILEVIAIISMMFFFRSFEVIKYWFESQVQAKYSTIVDSVVIFIGLCINITLILLKAPLIAFVCVVLFESILLAIGLNIIYKRKSKNILSWKVSLDKIKYMFKESYPLLLSGAVYILLVRLDQIMLGSMLGDKSVGIYAVSVRISESWMFIPTLIATSFFPAMLNARKSNYSNYISLIQHLLNIMALMGVIVGIAIIFLADPFINLIFGNSYSDSSTILIIHIWGMIFNAISIISFRYFLAEGLQIYSFYRAFAGLILNIGLNYFLIPIYGVYGAAISTVISQFVAVWVLNSISPKTRTMFFMQAKALFLINSIGTLKYINSLRREK